MFDTAWMMRSYRKPDKTPLQVIAERESVFQLLSQTKPDNLSRQLSNYTIDPRTRYLYLNLIFTTLPLYVDNNPNKIIAFETDKTSLVFCRYGTHINYVVVNPSQVRHLYVTSDTRLPSVSEVPRPKRYVSRRKSGKSSVCCLSLSTPHLLILA